MSIAETRERRQAKQKTQAQPQQPTAAQIDREAIREVIQAELQPLYEQLQAIRHALILITGHQEEANKAQAQDRRELQAISTAIQLLMQAVQARTLDSQEAIQESEEEQEATQEDEEEQEAAQEGEEEQEAAQEPPKQRKEPKIIELGSKYSRAKTRQPLHH